jgi:hypothetical protein
MDSVRPFDRSADDVGNIALLEHYNCVIDDQRLATLFYVGALGGTRDPYLFTGLDNMWVNFGRTQVHLPSRGGSPQRLRGLAHFVLPDLDAVAARIVHAREEMRRVAPERSHAFDATIGDGVIDLTCPWGNRIRCHPPSREWGGVELGLVCLEFDVPTDTAEGIARFYQDVMGAPARVQDRTAIVRAGAFQALRFRETDKQPEAYDGHHFAIYLADFSGPYAWLLERSARRPPPVPGGARGAQPEAPALQPAAGEPQSGDQQRGLVSGNGDVRGPVLNARRSKRPGSRASQTTAAARSDRARKVRFKCAHLN